MDQEKMLEIMRDAYNRSTEEENMTSEKMINELINRLKPMVQDNKEAN
ncbi:hypothetical protein ACFFGV_00175 [Pontibacillus salicampi]|uniref:Sporulation histidine kinase inhibitor Sda n=1 Tax=Pontibacillus salicampi TaxID=1449801 RepID=A0ABV6LHZ3_9BACI